MAHIIALTNHKGGVGKTTTVCNLAYCLSRKKKTVLVMDCDPQGNASLTLGEIPPFEQEVTLADLFTDKNATLLSCATQSKYDNLDLIPNNLDAAALGGSLSLSDPKRFLGLKNKLDEKAQKTYDYILLDCPPSIDSMFLVNALVIADFFIVPIDAESNYALSGVDSLLKAIEGVADSVNPSLQLLGALITLFDSRTTAAKFLIQAIEDYFGKEQVFTTRIHRNTAINKATMLNRTVCDYESRAAGCRHYRSLAREVEKRIVLAAQNG